MATSTIPAVKAAILAALRARAGLASMQIEWAHPGQHIQPETIFLDNAVMDEEAAALGNRQRSEEYVVPVVVSVLREGDDAQGAEERMWALVAEVEDELRTNTTLAQPGVWAVEITGAEPHNFIESTGRVAECSVRVSVKARI